MRILIIADTFPPLRTSGAVQLRDLAREFVIQGHEPAVIVPDGGLTAPWTIEQAYGATVLRCRAPTTKDIGYVRRTINEWRLPYVLLRGLRQSDLRARRWEGIVWYSPTIFLGPIVRILRREHGCRSYLILRDIFPQWALDLGLMRKGPAYFIFKLIERGQYAAADTIGVQAPANLQYIGQRAKHPGQRVEVLQNWLADASDVGCRIRVEKTALAGRTIFVYAGNMGVAQGMDVFLDFAERMRARRDIGFLFVGRGSDAARLAATAQARRLDNVIFHEEIEPEEVPGLLAQCHIGMLALDPKHKTHNVPGKFLTYMQAGLPVLARVNPGNDLVDLIRNEGVGRVCVDGDAQMLQRLAQELLADSAAIEAMRTRARSLSKQLFSSKNAVIQIVKALSGPHGGISPSHQPEPAKSSKRSSVHNHKQHA